MSGKRTEVYVRGSRDGTIWTPWDGPYIFTSSGTLPLSATFSSNTYRYLQYRLVMYSSSDSTVTPVIDYVKFNYDPLGSEGDLATDETPVEPGDEVVRIFDVLGRLVYEGRRSDFQPEHRGVYMLKDKVGWHRVIVR